MSPKAAKSEDTPENSKGMPDLSLLKSQDWTSLLLVSRAEVRLCHPVLLCILVQGFSICSGDVELVT